MSFFERRPRSAGGVMLSREDRKLRFSMYTYNTLMSVDSHIDRGSLVTIYISVGCDGNAMLRRTYRYDFM